MQERPKNQTNLFNEGTIAQQSKLTSGNQGREREYGRSSVINIQGPLTTTTTKQSISQVTVFRKRNHNYEKKAETHTNNTFKHTQTHTAREAEADLIKQLGNIANVC